jgi:serpin B
LPRFTTQQSFNIAPALKSLGMNLAFGNMADFSGMDGSTNLYLSNVFHKSFVEVNEEGTEATAVTLIELNANSAVDEFSVDHPFIFLIRENGIGTILFLGRIIDPTK